MLKRLLRRITSGELGFAHDMPSGPPRDRQDFIVELCTGMRVFHLGFVDEYLLEAKRERGQWLHERLAAVASELIGIDVDVSGVEAARELGHKGYVADAQDRGQLSRLGLEPADVVIAGEVIEHLESPGNFLGAVHELVRPGGILCVTTPNASALTNLVGPLFGLELVHPDHMVIFSPRTLTAILERSGWVNSRITFYQRPPRPDLARGAGGKALAGGRRMVSLLVLLVPGWSDGLIAVARAPENPVERSPQETAA